jgi:hypothetical protein
MNSFYTIINRIIEKYNKKETFLLLSNFFHYFSSDKNAFKVQKKYDFLKELQQNPFLKEESKKEIRNIFYQCQKVYFAFSKLAFSYKWKRSKIVIDTDLGLNQISLNQKNVICVFHQGSRYLFIVSDLINVFITALTYSPSFFSSPLAIKNPYNNLPFTISNLYYIYFTLFFRCIPIPDIIKHFFQLNFDLDTFEKENEMLIREYAIRNIIYSMNPTIMHSKIRFMLQYYNKQHFKKIEVDNDFSKEKIVEIFQPYLYLFYVSIFSLDPNKKRKSGDLWEKMLFRLRFYFPLFGRKIIKTHSSFPNFSIGESCSQLHNIVKIKKEKRKQEKRKSNLRKKNKRIREYQKKHKKGVFNKPLSSEQSIKETSSFIFPITFSEEENRLYFSSFSKPPLLSSTVSFNEECPCFFSDNEKKQHFLKGHLGLMQTESIEELLKVEKYVVNVHELERDRIPIQKKNLKRKNDSSEDDEQEDEEEDDYNEEELMSIFII